MKELAPQYDGRLFIPGTVVTVAMPLPSAPTVRISPSRWSFQLTKAMREPSRDQLG